jgi:formimidoylglutamate deiminase
MKHIDARWALTEAGWLRDVRVTLADDGRIESIADAPGLTDPRIVAHRESAAAEATADLLIPGMPDAHCHAFQYAIAGRTERSPVRGDAFRNWRDRMQAAIGALDVDALEGTATALYRRLRAAGYTSVAEFHCVHRLGPEPGRRGSLPSAVESAGALARAAAAAGVSLLLLPVLHRWGGFGRAELTPRQARFALARDDYRRLFEGLLAQAGDPELRGAVRIGVAAQSLRACDADDLRWLLSLRESLAPDCPVHLRVAEQADEVREAHAALGASPIAWLCEHMPVDRRWTLARATHASDDELREVAARGAVIAACPSSEANLADGSFRIEAACDAGVRWALGSDSNVGIDPAEELRWLEYAARLRRQVRPALVDADCPHPGAALWRRAVAGGRGALGIDAPGLSVGAPGELLLLSCEAELGPDEALDDFVFARRATRLVASVTDAGVLSLAG